MSFGSRLANVRAPIFRSLYCTSSQNLIKKALPEITANSQGLLKSLFSYRWFLSYAPTAHHNINLTPRHWRRRYCWGGDSSVVVSASQLEGFMYDSPTPSESP